MSSSPLLARLPALLAAATLLSVGCYDSHSVFGASPSRDGGTSPFRDGGSVPGFDGGGPVPTDGGPVPGFDGGGPIPATDGGGPIPATDGGPIPTTDSGPGPRDAGPRPDAGPPSRALRFGRPDFARVPAAPGLDLTTGYTLEMWIRPRSVDTGTLSLKGVPDSLRHQYGVAVEDGSVVVSWSGRGRLHQLRAPILPREWTHVAMVVRAGDADRSLMQLLLDGEVRAEATLPNDLLDAVNDRPLIFGTNYDGDLDEIRLWRLARLPAGIRATMRSRVSGSLPGLQGYWPLEEAGQLALDRTLHGHDAVLGRLTTPDPADPTWILSGAI